MDHQHHGMQQPNGSGMDSNYFVPAQGVVAEKGPVMAAQQPGYPPYQDGQYQHPDPQYQQYPAEYGGAPLTGYPPAESGYPPAATGAAPRTVLGMKRGTFLAVAGVTAILLALVIGLGAGLGVSQRNLHDKEGELADIRANLTGSGSPTVYVTMTSSASATKTSATSSPTTSFVNECPKSNNTVYTASSGGKEFRKFCGIDYGGNGEADDLGNVKTKSMDACIDACAAKTSCEGAGWGILDGDQGNLHACWMKTNLTKSHNATSDWNFAVLIDSEET